MTSAESLRRMQFVLKAILALSIGLFGLIVGYTNIVDYDSNWQFVSHVLAMDSFESFFDSTSIQDRAITNESVQRAFYTMIIAGELVTGALFAIGGALLAMSAVRGGDATVGKIAVVGGAVVAILIWYTGFAVIGSEWFAMWASTWDGQMKAYTFAGFILLAVLYITQPE